VEDFKPCGPGWSAYLESGRWVEIVGWTNQADDGVWRPCYWHEINGLVACEPDKIQSQ
jgi:hypothetical protein